ncbi:MAG: hypothetical protein GX129_01945 [Clostridiales bacterium]|jgi:uncharacterized protein YjdB|nr:hypothetical protein [Clostridiales bacterium]
MRNLFYAVRDTDAMFGSNNKSKSLSNNLYKGIIILIILLVVIFSLYRNSGLFYRKGIILPFSLNLNRQEVYLVKGEEFRVFVYGINKRVSFHSTNFRVAGVNFNGRVFAYQTGKAFIIAKVDGRELKCRVKVIDINKERLNLNVGDTYRLGIKGPAFIAKYKSSNSRIATVNIFGKVKAKKPGKTTITVIVKGKLLKCAVTVR